MEFKVLAFLIFIPTIAFVPHFAYLFAIFYIVFFRKNNIHVKIDNNIKLIFLIIMFMLFNKLLHINIETLSIKEIFPSAILLFATYYIAINLTRRDLNALLVFIIIEACIVFLEYYFGVTTFFTSLDRYRELGGMSNNSLLYSFRPMGVSENSSILAVKLFLGLLIVYYNRNYFNEKMKILIPSILLIGLFFSFNRTAFVAIIMFYLAVTIKFYLTQAQSRKVFYIKIFIFLFFIFLAFFISYYFFDIIYMQFTRNNTDDILTGRGEIWHSFRIFIENNILFGNGSYKLYLPFYHGGWVMAHAHNSYLELIATNGIIISLFYFVLILKNIRLDNIIYIIAFLTYSLAQYFIFWGISIQDIMFFYFLTFHQRRSIDVA